MVIGEMIKMSKEVTKFGKKTKVFVYIRGYELEYDGVINEDGSVGVTVFDDDINDIYRDYGEL